MAFLPFLCMGFDSAVTRIRNAFRECTLSGYLRGRNLSQLTLTHDISISAVVKLVSTNDEPCFRQMLQIELSSVSV